jgi:hypothetical protein
MEIRAPRVKRRGGVLLLVCAALSFAPAPAAESPFPGWIVVADDDLARMRGGLGTKSGIEISFGIESLVFVNGELQARTALRVDPDSLANVSSLVRLIQSGSSGTFETKDLGSLSFLTAIQNDLDGQLIQNLTVIDASVKSLGVARSLRGAFSLERQLVDSLP